VRHNLPAKRHWLLPGTFLASGNLLRYISIYISIHTYIYTYTHIQVHHGLPVKRDWLPPGAFLASENHLLNKLWSKESEYELVKLYVSFAKEPYKRDDSLQRASMSW